MVSGRRGAQQGDFQSSETLFLHSLIEVFLGQSGIVAVVGGFITCLSCQLTQGSTVGISNAQRIAITGSRSIAGEICDGSTVSCIEHGLAEILIGQDGLLGIGNANVDDAGVVTDNGDNAGIITILLTTGSIQAHVIDLAADEHLQLGILILNNKLLHTIQLDHVGKDVVGVLLKLTDGAHLPVGEDEGTGADNLIGSRAVSGSSAISTEALLEQRLINGRGGQLAHDHGLVGLASQSDLEGHLVDLLVANILPCNRSGTFLGLLGIVSRSIDDLHGALANALALGKYQGRIQTHLVGVQEGIGVHGFTVRPLGLVADGDAPGNAVTVDVHRLTGGQHGDQRGLSVHGDTTIQTAVDTTLDVTICILGTNHAPCIGSSVGGSGNMDLGLGRLLGLSRLAGLGSAGGRCCRSGGCGGRSAGSAGGSLIAATSNQCHGHNQGQNQCKCSFHGMDLPS